MHFSVLTALFAVVLLSVCGVSIEVSEHDVVRVRVRRQNSLEVDGAGSGDAGRGSSSSFGAQPVSLRDEDVRPRNSLPPSKSAPPSSRDSIEMMEELVYGLPGLVSKKIVVRSKLNRGGAAFRPQSVETFRSEQPSSIPGAVPVSTEVA